MSKCELEVRFVGDERTYQPGSSVRGEVVVTTDRDLSCKGLTIQLGWKTHGIGNTDRLNLEETVVGAQEWNQGRRYSYPFRFTAPAQPLTYHGHFLNIDHYVEARADLPWALDAKVSEDYVLVPGTSSRGDYMTAPIDFSQPQSKKKGSFVTKVIGWLLAPIIIALLLALLVVALPIVAVIGAVILVRRFAAERRLGRVSVEVAAPTIEDKAKAGGTLTRMRPRAWRSAVYAIAPGDSVRYSVRFMPKATVEVTRVVGTLVGEEVCRSGVGTNAKTHRHSVHRQEGTLAEGATYAGGTPVELRGELVVPEMPAYSFKGGQNQLAWKLALVVDLPKWADWTHEVKLGLVPGAGDF